MTETVEVERGKLIFTREGRKLIKVSFVPTPLEEMIQDDCLPCVHCRILVRQADNGTYYDFTDRFLCHVSPTAMHAGYVVTRSAV